MARFTILPKWVDELVKQYTPKHRRLVSWLIFALLMTSGFLILRPAFAGVEEFFGYPEGTKNLYLYVLSGVSARSMLSICFGKDTIDTVNSMTAINAVMNFAAALGLIFVMVHVVMAIIDYSQHGEMTIERLYKLILTFALPVFLIINVNMLNKAIQGAGLIIKDKVVSVITEGGEEITEEEKDEWEKSSNNPLGLVLQLEKKTLDQLSPEDRLIIQDVYINGVYHHIQNVISGSKEETDETPMTKDEELELMFKSGQGGTSSSKIVDLTLNFILKIIIICIDIGIRMGIMIACYGALGRFVVYQAFLPFGIADIGKEGVRSNGMRMIKLYFSIYLEIAMYYLVMVVGWRIFDALILKQSTVAGIVVCYIGAGAGIRALMRGARTLTERILNVR